MLSSLSRSAQLIKFFAQQGPGVPRKHLVKMAYMADLISRQYLGHPISEFTYVVYLYGPYPPEFERVIEELEQHGLAWTHAVQKSTPDERTPKKLFDSGKPIVFDFSSGENEVLAHVVRSFLKMDTEEFVEDIVYPTAPFQAALTTNRLKEVIPMEMVNGEGMREVGFDLEKVLAAERQAKEGNYLSGREYFGALRDRIAARYAERDDAFIEDSFVGLAAQLAAADALVDCNSHFASGTGRVGPERALERLGTSYEATT